MVHVQRGRSPNDLLSIGKSTARIYGSQTNKFDARCNEVLGFTFQTHHLSCLGNPEDFKGIDCHVFHDPHPMTLALSVLVTIEMLNAMNR